MERYNLWKNSQENRAVIEYYKPLQKSNDVAILIFPGGGYGSLSLHEGEDYAHLLNGFGFTAFVVKYRVAPNYFPLPLLDARRAIRFVRAKAESFDIDKNKVLVMGSSAGGHLAALVSTCNKEIGEEDDELRKEDFLPNGQILCYPVISAEEDILHADSYYNLLGAAYKNKKKYSPDLLVTDKTPPAFIWHTTTDNSVSCINSFRYAEELWKKGVPCELHTFCEGEHGLGIAPQCSHVAQWTVLLKNWVNRYYLEG